MKENAVAFGRDRSLIGVLTERRTARVNEKDTRTGVLLISSGLDHHVGPNRLYVKLARRLAESGSYVFRFGFSGIGDSGPRRDKLPEFESVMDETRQAMDYLEYLRGIKRYCCIGLCSGADTAAAALKTDQRVNKAILINPLFTRVFQGTLREQMIVYRKYALSNIKSWIRLFTLRSDYLRIWRMIRGGIDENIQSKIVNGNNNCNVQNKIKEYFQTIKAKDARILMVFSHTEFGDLYLKKVLGKEYRSLIESRIFSIERIKNADHTIMQLTHQNDLINMISNFLSQRP